MRLRWSSAVYLCARKHAPHVADLGLELHCSLPHPLTCPLPQGSFLEVPPGSGVMSEASDVRAVGVYLKSICIFGLSFLNGLPDVEKGTPCQEEQWSLVMLNDPTAS